MDSRKKNILLGILIVGVLAMTVAFAALTTRLSINGTANVAATRWNIHFRNWVLDTNPTITVDGNTQQNTAQYPQVNQLSMSDNTNVTKVSGINVTLNQPNDYVKYNFEIINEGTIDGKLDNFTHDIECESGKTCDFMEYEVKCFESNTREGTEVTENSVLTANGGKAYCYLQVKYKNISNHDISKADTASKVAANVNAAGTNQVYEQSATSASLSAAWSWIQDGTTSNSGSGSSSSGTYGYVGQGSTTDTENGWPTELNPNWKVYLRQNTLTQEIETCGVYPSGTVCLASSSSGYSSDFADVSGTTSNITTTSGLEATGLKGYSLAKAEEMLSKGASLCDIRVNYVICNMPSSGSCNVDIYGNVTCSDGSYFCYSGGSDGVVYCIDDD